VPIVAIGLDAGGVGIELGVDPAGSFVGTLFAFIVERCDRRMRRARKDGSGHCGWAAVWGVFRRVLSVHDIRILCLVVSLLSRAAVAAQPSRPNSGDGWMKYRWRPHV
jgi:hypothetical protein